MKKRNFILIAVMTFIMNSYSLENQELLKKIDEVNSFGNDFAFEMEVTSFHGDSLILTNTLNGFVQTTKNLEIKSLLYFISPNDVKGRKMLIEGKYIWALFPQTKNLIRLTPLQILLGEVAYGDVLRIIFSEIYEVNKIEENKIDGIDYYFLNLIIKKDKLGENYYAVNLKVEKQSLRIVYSEMLSSTNKLIKKVYYSDAMKYENKTINSLIKIVDGVQPDNYSLLKYKKVAKKKVPSGFFNKEYLTKFKNYEF
ncbi:MAG: outer membrane lipoprotein-sorting protein [Crenarchaeota archaeon]|nr:outer membrane lipoprotein-sorting protein [Thermoproteota archaeon]